MKLLELDDQHNLIAHAELFILKPFVELRDDRKNPELMMKELGFIYHMYDMKSDFQFNTDPTARMAEVKRYVNLPKTWKPDKLMSECVNLFEYLSQTVAGDLLKSAYIAINSLNVQLKGIDLDERDKNNRPIWNIKQFGDTMKQVPAMIESIEQSEKAYIRGQENNERLRGQKMKSLYEDGIIIRRLEDDKQEE